MQGWEKPVFACPFELWREEDVLQLTLARHARMALHDTKELARLVAALDPTGHAPILLEYPEGVEVTDDARRFLRRTIARQGHPIAFFTHDLNSRLHGELFKRMHAPAFPFRIFTWRTDAVRWVRERRQLALLNPRP